MIWPFLVKHWDVVKFVLIAFAVLGAVLWLRADAANRALEDRERESLEQRIDDIQDNEEKKDELQNLDDKSLLDRALEWVR